MADFTKFLLLGIQITSFCLPVKISAKSPFLIDALRSWIFWGCNKRLCLTSRGLKSVEHLGHPWSHPSVVGIFLDQNLSGKEQELYLISISSPYSTRLAENINTGFSWSAFPTSPVLGCQETGRVHHVPASSTYAGMAEDPLLLP